MVDPQERKDLLVLLVKMAVLVLPAPPDPVGSPATSASPAPRDLVVTLASLATRDLLALLD